TACHAEQRVQPGLAAGGAETLGDHPEQQRMVKHLVVPGEITDRQQIDASIPLHLPMSSPQLTAHLTQARFIQAALPIGFEGFLQLSVMTDTGESKGVGDCHEAVSINDADILSALAN